MKQSKTKVIFFGDSITQAGVLPGGYITMMGEQLKKQGKADQFLLVGAGISGHKIYDLYLRMDKDVISQKPNVVFVFIGVNDVWHKQTHGTGTDADRFEKFYNALIGKLKASGIKVVLCTPALIGEKINGGNPQDTELDKYADIVRELAKSNRCQLVDLRRLCLDYERTHNQRDSISGVLTTDGVHLNEAGNRLVASSMLDALLRN